MKQVPFSNIKLDGFWKKRFDINKEITIPTIYNRFTETGRFEAFKFNWKEGMPNKPHIFWDSDIAKWMEAVAYTIQLNPDKELEKIVDETVDLIEKNQCEDGYFNVYFTVVEPDKRFTNRDMHELYCAGHLTEAAVAYFNATGKDKFLKLMCKYMDCIEKAFITEKTARFSTPGHEEIELALIRLYRCTKDKKYLEMCRFFIENRGKCKNDNDCRNWTGMNYDQSDAPVRELKEASGHSVRAMYLYCGMADLAAETNDKSLFDACERLFDNIYFRRMYITGGIGSTSFGEAFAEDYVLPNDLAYSETCASIGLALFAARMGAIVPDSKYADAAELAIYNCILSGVSLKGNSFFYVNPLEINMNRHRIMKTYYSSRENLLTHRLEVFDCSCCPPNLARFVASIGNFIYTCDENTVICHHFIESEAEFDNIRIKQQTGYPNRGDVRFSISGMKGKKFGVRIPGWCTYVSLNGKILDAPITKGYAYIDISEENLVLDFYFEMKTKLICANPKVEDDIGKVCVCRGPLVYCIESSLNDDIPLNSIYIDKEIKPGLEFDEEINAYRIITKAHIYSDESKLYYDVKDRKISEKEITLLPYYAFANHGDSDMKIWLRTE